MITAESEADLFAQLRLTMARVRWLRRGCLALLAVDIGGAFLLWAARHPQTLGL